MRAILEQLMLLASALFVAVAVSSGNAQLVALGVAAVAIAAVLAAQTGSLVASPALVSIGARARDHRQLLSAQPAPSHPTTAGRPLGRAPTQAVPAA
jgi:hypothetical protein